MTIAAPEHTVETERLRSGRWQAWVFDHVGICVGPGTGATEFEAKAAAYADAAKSKQPQ